MVGLSIADGKATRELQVRAHARCHSAASRHEDSWFSAPNFPHLAADAFQVSAVACNGWIHPVAGVEMKISEQFKAPPQADKVTLPRTPAGNIT
ncbi:MAG TPA: hypothetical protein VGJ76_14335, partial [Pseudolabrys sp.]